MKNNITFLSFLKNYFFNLFFWYKNGFESFILFFELLVLLFTKKKQLFKDPFIYNFIFNNIYINNIFFIFENFISFFRFFSPLFINLLSFFSILFVFSGGFEFFIETWHYLPGPGYLMQPKTFLDLYFTFLGALFCWVWNCVYFFFYFFYIYITAPFLFVLDFLKTPDVEFLLAFSIIFFLFLVFDNLKIFDKWLDSLELNKFLSIKNLEKNNLLFNNVLILNLLINLKTNINVLLILIHNLKIFYIFSIVLNLFSKKYILKYLQYQKSFQNNILIIINSFFGTFWLFSYLKYYYFLNLSNFFISFKNTQYVNQLKNISFLKNVKKDIFFNWFILLYDTWFTK